MAEQKILSWDELIASVRTAEQHPGDTAWNIYRYLKANIPDTKPGGAKTDSTLSSEEARMLLATYMKIPQQRPSLLHSCILGVAVKMSAAYPDFRFSSFLQLWGYPSCLRTEDTERQRDKSGREYLSLKERTDRALSSYLLHHPEQRVDGQDDTFLSMIAVKVFETEHNGRKLRSVKLIGAKGEELLADSHLFPCKPWEIVGRMYDVLTRTSKEGVVRSQEIVVSSKKMQDVFPAVTGYVDRVDESHRHYHVFDSLSRHFVAENPKPVLAPDTASARLPKAGDFVVFSPIIPERDKFKSAVIHEIMPAEEGRKSFGMLEATVSYVNVKDGYFYYNIISDIPSTPEGTITKEGSAQLAVAPNQLQVGQKILLTLFLTRGKDRLKRNHVVIATLAV